MWIFYIALSLFILFTAYFFVLPLSKKRPVLIKQNGLVTYCAILAAALYSLQTAMPFSITIAVIAFFVFIFKTWFVYGVTEIMISDALSKAASATRASIENNDGGYKIDNNLRIRIHKIMGRISIVSFKKGGESKKAKLTVVVFKKFIQNYFV